MRPASAHLRRVRGPRQPPRAALPVGGDRARRLRRDLLLERHRVPRDDVRGLQGPGRAHQHQPPLLHGRARGAGRRLGRRGPGLRGLARAAGRRPGSRAPRPVQDDAGRRRPLDRRAGRRPWCPRRAGLRRRHRRAAGRPPGRGRSLGRRPLRALHGRHHGAPQGRGVAPGGCPVPVLRRGRPHPAQPGVDPRGARRPHRRLRGDLLLPAAADARRRPVGGHLLAVERGPGHPAHRLLRARARVGHRRRRGREPAHRRGRRRGQAAARPVARGARALGGREPVLDLERRRADVGGPQGPPRRRRSPARSSPTGSGRRRPAPRAPTASSPPTGRPPPTHRRGA